MNAFHFVGGILWFELTLSPSVTLCIGWSFWQNLSNRMVSCVNQHIIKQPLPIDILFRPPVLPRWMSRFAWPGLCTLTHVKRNRTRGDLKTVHSVLMLILMVFSSEVCQVCCWVTSSAATCLQQSYHIIVLLDFSVYLLRVKPNNVVLIKSWVFCPTRAGRIARQRGEVGGV